MEPIKDISIIIPLYNSELYIENCVRQVLSQSLKNLELIIVNDGSTDNSLYIVQNIAKLDGRIQVFSKDNGGASSARNFGLKKAKGKYILFLDSDDYWMDNDMLQKLFGAINVNSEIDFILFNGCYSYKHKNLNIFPNINMNQNLNKLEKFQKMVELGAVNISPCMRIVNRDFLINNDIIFVEGIINEDVLWSVEMIEKCSNFNVIDSIFYSYNQENQESVTSTINEKKIEDCIFVLEKLLDLDKRNITLSFVAYMYVILLFNVLKVDDQMYQNNIYNRLLKYKYLLKYNLHPKVRKLSLLYNCFGYNGLINILKIYKYLK